MMTSNTTPASESPLEGVESQTLDELMSRDPLDLGQADLEKIVSILREQRKRWLVEVQAPKAAKPKAAGKKAASQADIEDLMKDLGLS